MGASTPARRGEALPLTLCLLIYLSVLIRMVLRPAEEGAIGPPAYALMAAFLALGVVQVALSRRRKVWTHVSLALSCIVVIALLMTEPSNDYYAVLCMGLSMVATRDLDPPSDLVWLAVLCVSAAFGLLLAFELDVAVAVSYIPIYIVACLLLGLWGRALRRAESARERSEALRAELEEANGRLRVYAQQAQELAASQERARLAGELHDAATQTVFSINLTAEAARMALTQHPERVAGLLDRLQELARDALAEMRTLVRELRPPSPVEVGLVEALRRHLATLDRRDGPAVELEVSGRPPEDPELTEVLYRAACEALNNVAKHSGAKHARVELSFTPDSAHLRVSDPGRGFDPAGVAHGECFGLATMRERVLARRGTMCVDTAPGRGTRVEITLPLGGV